MGGRSSKENNVLILQRKTCVKCRLSQHSLTPVAIDGISKSFGCNEGNLSLRSLVTSTGRDSDERAIESLSALENSSEFQAGFDGSHKPILDGELLAPLGTTTRQDVTAALGGHASTKAMALGPLPLVGLICTLHIKFLLKPINAAKLQDCTGLAWEMSISEDKYTSKTTGYCT